MSRDYLYTPDECPNRRHPNLQPNQACGFCGQSGAVLTFRVVDLDLRLIVNDRIVGGRVSLRVPIADSAVEAVREAGFVTREVLRGLAPAVLAEVERQLMAEPADLTG